MPKQSLVKRVRLYVIIGLVVGVIFSAFAAVLHLATGGAVLARLGISYLDAVVVYFAAGIVGGAVFAVLFPLRRNRFGAMLIGFWTVLPLYAGSATVLLPRDEWFPVGVVLGAIASLLIGVPLGYLVWQDEYSRSRRK